MLAASSQQAPSDACTTPSPLTSRPGSSTNSGQCSDASNGLSVDAKRQRMKEYIESIKAKSKASDADVFDFTMGPDEWERSLSFFINRLKITDKSEAAEGAATTPSPHKVQSRELLSSLERKLIEVKSRKKVKPKSPGLVLKSSETTPLQGPADSTRSSTTASPEPASAVESPCPTPKFPTSVRSSAHPTEDIQDRGQEARAAYYALEEAINKQSSSNTASSHLDTTAS